MDGSIWVPLPRFFSTKTSSRVVFYPYPYSISELKPNEPRRHFDDRARTPMKGARSPPVVIYFDSFCAFRSIDFESFAVISNKQLDSATSSLNLN
jgi:hypothetical protein